MENRKTSPESSTYGENLDGAAGAAGPFGQAVVDAVVDAPRHAALSALLSYRSDRPLEPGTLLRVPLGRRVVTAIAWAAGAAAPAEAPPLRDVAEVLDVVPPLTADWRALADFAAAYYQRSAGEIALSVLPPELRRLDRATLADRVRRLDARRRGAAAGPTEEPRPPTAAQAEAVRRIVDDAAAAAPASWLLHGVTGSGKTEVYLRAAHAALEQGRQALVLVPEINLTPQLVARFAARFGAGRVVAMHSGLTPVQRLRSWLAAHLGQADLVLGTRMAVFASLPRLGLVVVDEEHDASYKQQESARYSARDLAVWRGRRERVPVVLGSATPSLETWQHAQAGRYRLLSLPDRIGGARWPTVRLVDVGGNAGPEGRRLSPAVAARADRPAAPPTVAARADPAALPTDTAADPTTGTTAAGRPPRALPPGLAAPLVAALEERLARGEQAVVLLNRRGYAPVLQCGDCGWMSACPHCSAWRVFHKSDRTLRCHHCAASVPVPRACPECGNHDIAPIGRGTERLEEQLAALLPTARIARIDGDSARRKGALEATLGAMHAGDVDVLVGTQMVAKGHDFRRVGLVAAVNADGALFSSDFRAPERLFALLMQAAGRAGRDAEAGAASEMWVQTAHPGHPVYRALVGHDYAAFAAAELKDRESAGLPPFSHLAMLRAEAKTAEAARAFLAAAATAAALLAEASEVMVYPPVPLDIARVAEVERMQMLVESSSRPRLQALLRAWLPLLDGLHAERGGAGERILRWAIDVDPLTI